MGKFDGCLLACDIDGTLLYGNTLPERNIKRVKDFVSEGGVFSLSTGRSAIALSDVTTKIDCISPSVLSNGCVIYDFKKGIPVSQKYLSGSSLQLAKQIIERGDIGVEMHTADSIFVPVRSMSSDIHEEYEHMSAVFTDFNSVKDKKINKIIYFIEHEYQRKLLDETSKGYTDECNFYNTCSFIGGIKQNYFEQLPKGVSKAEALLALVKNSNIKKGGFFAIGDYYNDVEMLKAADISAVPCDSPDDVKAVATYITGSAADGAVADFIDYLEEIF